MAFEDIHDFAYCFFVKVGQFQLPIPGSLRLGDLGSLETSQIVQLPSSLFAELIIAAFVAL